jgi:hypothetical protein
VVTNVYKKAGIEAGFAFLYKKLTIKTQQQALHIFDDLLDREP